MNGIQLHDLPESAQNIVRLIGIGKALRLIERLGGTTFPVAKGLTRMGQARYELLAEVIGMDASDTLTAEYGGETLYVPSCKAALRRVRDRAIHTRFDAMVKGGHSANGAVAELALEHKISDRRIWDILKVLPDSQDVQQTLF
ncbi:MAG: DNA transposition protein [Halothiobacillaceae bacterium]|nr:MAG: DNA transposition protein [Halothiobacillaceae bacterium]